jgi:hypothetical protein
LGLPVTKTAFYESQGRPTSDYTKRFWHWPAYRRGFVEEYEAFRPLLTALKVAVIEDATFEQFIDVWAEGIQAVILFPHWTRDGVEYRNGPMSVSKIVDAIPASFVGTFDLCVCHPQALVKECDRQRPRLLTRAIWEEAEPNFWCMFYRALFAILSSGDYSYPEALDRTARIVQREMSLKVEFVSNAR